MQARHQTWRYFQILQADFKRLAIKTRYFIVYLVYPEYHEWMDNTLNLSDMRKFKFLKAQVKSPNLAVKKNTDSEMEELKVLMDLRKTSSLFKM